MVGELASRRIKDCRCLLTGQHRLRAQSFGQEVNPIPLHADEINRTLAQSGQITLELTDVRNNVSIASVNGPEPTLTQINGGHFLRHETRRGTDGSTGGNALRSDPLSIAARTPMACDHPSHDPAC
jgi:hypothetical protein